MRGELPKTRLKYQEFPWSNFISGQVFKFKEQKFQVMKVSLLCNTNFRSTNSPSPLNAF